MWIGANDLCAICGGKVRKKRPIKSNISLGIHFLFDRLKNMHKSMRKDWKEH